MGSERLPGKHMREIGGKPIIEHLIDRVRRVKKLDGMVMAIPDTSENDVLEKFCSSKNIPCYRGSEDDVVSRILGALEQENADIGVQIYGDGYLNDPKLIDEVIEEYLEDDSYDLVGNDMKATYPSGCYSEAFSVKAFKDSVERNTDPAIREHGTLFIRQNPELYKIKNIEAEGKLCRPDIHLDVDTEEDMQVMESIINHFSPRDDFGLEEIIEYLDENPEIMELNKNVQRRWKEYQRA